MSVFEPTAACLKLAEQLNAGELTEAELPAALKPLPSLTRQTLEVLARAAEEAGVTQPRLGWAIAAVADAHLADGGDPLLRARAAWYLARAANAWARPERVEHAVRRARAGFTELGESGWAAASDWQRYALPWARNDYAQAASVLDGSLAGMQDAGLDEFIPHGQLSLAYAQILIGLFTEAEANITASEMAFAALGDRLNLARCWLHRSSILRRQGEHEHSLAQLKRALSVFESPSPVTEGDSDGTVSQQAPIDVAKTHFQLGYTQWRVGSSLEVAEQHFMWAISTFAEKDLPLWVGQGYGGLAQIYTDAGRLDQARDALEKARAIYRQYDVLGLRADNLLDSGRLEMFWSHPARSLEYLSQAEDGYMSLGTRRMAAIAAMYRGRASAQFGYYQQALRHLERSETYLQKLEEPERLAECAMHLAQVWTRLGRPEQAHHHLKRAAQYYRDTNQLDFLATVYHRQAETYFQEGRQAEAIAVLEQALAIAQAIDWRSEIALSHLLLGEAWLAKHKPDEAEVTPPEKVLGHLQTARDQFAEMGMLIEQAACQVALGEYFVQNAEFATARQAWEQALRLSEAVMPDVAWRAEAGLADLAERTGEADQAMQAYRRMIANLAKVRRGILQPALAGTYLHVPAQALDQAVDLAARLMMVADVLDFIEESKAQTVAVLLSRGESEQKNDFSSRLDGMIAEIRRSQEQLRTAAASRLVTSEQAERIRQVKRKIQQYDEAVSRLERQHIPDQPDLSTHQDFDRERFRQVAGKTLGESWVAVHYYLREDRLIIAMLAPHDLKVWRRTMGARERLALQGLRGVWPAGRALLPENLRSLGELLLPESLQAYLNQRSADTNLLILPHRQLHQIPWAALTTQSGALVSRCVPVVLPSLNSLPILWSRSAGTSPDPPDGLILAVSNFNGRRPPLPVVAEEAAALSAKLGPGGALLSESTATTEKLLVLGEQNGLDRFAFWHVASHAFHDALTGRLSGFALFDRDLWLDQLWNLAPLPRLVTLSACQGSQSLVFEGDEPVGLTIACLAAGAQQVVGSLWPLPDAAAVRLMTEFYDQFWSGKGPAQALALAQRAAIYRSMAPGYWGGFVCVGSPV